MDPSQQNLTWQHEMAGHWEPSSKLKCHEVASEIGPMDPPNYTKKLPAVAEIALLKLPCFLAFQKFKANEAEIFSECRLSAMLTGICNSEG